MQLHRARGFGLDWLADIALDPLDSAPETSDLPDIAVTRVDRLTDRAKPRPINRGAVYADGFRFGWNDEASFDVFDGRCIDYCPGPDWRGELPATFFSTVVGLTLAWRGQLPLHATAVEVSGSAILIAGPAGAGKSTLAAELLQAGANLFSDDLTVLGRNAPDEPLIAFRGRNAIRLHPATAELVDASRCEPVEDDPRGKLLVRPRARSDADALPVGGLILLGNTSGHLPGRELAPLLPRLMFRPAWVSALPSRALHLETLLQLAAEIPACRLPCAERFETSDRARRSEEFLAAVAAMAG